MERAGKPRDGLRQWGHLFGGRYKAQVIDCRSRDYLAQACNYVHLNPRRARLLESGAKLESYPWRSYPGYLRPRLRKEWMRVKGNLQARDVEA